MDASLLAVSALLGLPLPTPLSSPSSSSAEAANAPTADARVAGSEVGTVATRCVASQVETEDAADAVHQVLGECLPGVVSAVPPRTCGTVADAATMPVGDEELVATSSAAGAERCAVDGVAAQSAPKTNKGDEAPSSLDMADAVAVDEVAAQSAPKTNEGDEAPSSLDMADADAVPTGERMSAATPPEIPDEARHSFGMGGAEAPTEINEEDLKPFASDEAASFLNLSTNSVEEMPPNPLVDSGCVQVADAGLLCLLPGRTKQHDVKVLWHSGTGEDHELKSSAVLHFDKEGYGFINFTECDEPVWAEELLGKSLWQSPDGREFICDGDGDSMTRRWRTEIMGGRRFCTIPLEVSGQAAEIHFWLYNCERAECNSRIFFELRSILRALGMSVDPDWLAKKISGKWATMWRRHGCSDKHVLVPYGSKAAAEAKGRRAQHTAISLQATLLLLVCLIVHQDEERQDSASSLLRSLLSKMCPSNFTFETESGMTCNAAMKIRVRAFQVIGIAELVRAVPKDWGCKTSNFPLRGEAAVHLSDFMLRLAASKTWQWLYDGFIAGIARYMASQVYMLGLPASPQENTSAAVAMAARNSADARAMTAAAMLKLARGQGGADLAEAPVVETQGSAGESLAQIAHERWNYHVAFKREMQGCRRFNLVDDDTNISGKDRTRGLLMNLETGITGWAAPLEPGASFIV